jgi:3-mercaptopyruvate sulfurtransferase SseA
MKNMTASLPLLIEADELRRHIHDPELLIVDLCGKESYLQGHIPGAVQVDTADLINGQPPAPGLLPSIEKLGALFSRLGLTPATPVVCYDNEGSPWAGRFIWTLDLIGHSRASVLNGGLGAWQASGFSLETTPHTRKTSAETFSFVANKNILMEQLKQELADNSELLVWDARSLAEYRGDKMLAQRGGHIPGAIHCEWTELLDENKKLRTDLAHFLESKGITPDKDIVTHCHTHRRSGLSYLAARVLGYPRIRAYAGSWSEWGNQTDTPVEKNS